MPARLNRHDLTAKDWERLRGFLPADLPRGGRWADRRLAISGILFRTRNDKNPPAGPGREALGRSRGGLSTKMHLAADRSCRPVARILSPCQHGECPRFISLLEASASAAGGRDGLALGPVPRWATRPIPLPPTDTYLRKRGIKAVIPVKEDQKAHRRNRDRAGGRPPGFDPDATRSAIPSNAALARSSSSALLLPATTSGNASSRALSTSPRCGSGCEIRSLDSPPLRALS